MKKRSFWIALACIVALSCVSISFTESKPKVNPRQIVGVWKIVYPQMQEVNGERMEKIKIITKKRFVWILTSNHRVLGELGGTYTFDGETYTEHIEYGLTSMNPHYFGSSVALKVSFKNNKMYASGQFGNEVYDEIWERVE
ncbi:MAG: hypothetical protein LBE91_18290 [Tannerella sp.]|jgi:hypothetical protein|nr:hypothetical protein [Tannerella sp.]